jgi:hypothetical protein
MFYRISYLKNDPSYEFIGKVILKIKIVSAEKIKAEVYVNQDKSLSDLQTLIKHSFLSYFHRELLMNFLNLFIKLFAITLLSIKILMPRYRESIHLDFVQIFILAMAVYG